MHTCLGLSTGAAAGLEKQESADLKSKLSTVPSSQAPTEKASDTHLPEEKIWHLTVRRSCTLGFLTCVLKEAVKRAGDM